MEPLSAISKLYVISTFVGSIFMVVSVLMGRLPHGHGAAHHGGGHGGHAGHGGHGGLLGHSGSAGHATQIGHGGAHSGGHAGAPGGHAASGHAIAGHGGQDVNVVQHAQSIRAHQIALQNQAGANAANNLGQDISMKLETRSGHLHMGLEERGAVEIILSLLNPLSIATFLAFFGLTGMIAGIALHINPIITFIAAVASGWLAVQAVIHLIAWLFANMHVSTESRVADLIGQMAEVNIPISPGRTGEIVYVVGSKRLTAPAKSLVPNLEIPRKATVIICDIKDHVMLVDVWHDDFVAQATEIKPSLQ